MYLALYRKYRPRSFDDVIGQPHITTTLRNQVAAGRTAHAYLFTGPRGTGKTTCSRILAMAVNCLSPRDGNPCLECELCRGLEQGSILDVVEIDAASNNGVDSIRQLRDEAGYTPAQCRYRVYIIDEIHMLSPGAFNALLKIMEEPPPHVKFILATTEAHKVPATILSRCQRFDFRRIRPEQIRERLLSIAGQEPFTLEEQAAGLIAQLADGGMRDACSLLDQCAAYSQEITPETVAQAAGVVDRSYLYELTGCVIRQEAGEAVALLDQLYAMSKDMQGLLEELIDHFRNLMLVRTLKRPEELVAALPEELERLRECAENLPLASILRSISLMQDCLDRMSRSFDKRLTLELCMVKLCTPSMDAAPEGLLPRLERLERALAQGTFSPAAAPAAPAAVPPPTLAPASRPAPAVPVVSAPPPGIQEPAPAAPAAAPAVPAESGFVPLDFWQEILQELAQTVPPLYGVLQGSRAFTGDGVLYIDSPLAITAVLKQDNHAARLAAAVEARTGQRYKIRVKSAAPKAPKADKLSGFLDKARQAGVEVREEP